MKLLTKLWATTFGSGFSPVAPGTAGALVGLGIYAILPPFSNGVFLVIISVIFFSGVWVSTRMEKEYGHDAQLINIDEVVGVLIALYNFEKTWPILLAGFALFRLFDIWKPYPVNRVQDLPRGWGVMMDDVLAGVMANLVLRLAIFLVSYL